MTRRRTYKYSRVLTREQERELCEKVAAGCHKSLNTLCRHTMAFVRFIASRYRHRGVKFPDLVSAGNLGMVEAARRYKTSYGVRFATYSFWYIRQKIELELARMGGPVGVPHVVYANRSRDARRGEEVGSVLGVELGEALRVESNVSREDASADLARIMKRAKLSPRQLQCVSMVYGLDGNGGRTQADTAESLGVSKPSVQCHIDHAMRKLRAAAA